MSWLQNVFNLIKQKIWHNQKGNANLFFLAALLLSTMFTYYFVVVLNITDEDKERIAHFYNAYKMAEGVQNSITNTFLLKGVSEVTFKDEDGNLRFTKEEFERIIKMDNGAIFTLERLVADQMVSARQDKTAERLGGGTRYYDAKNTKIKVVFDMAIDHYDQNGDAQKKVREVRYYVNLAGDSATEYDVTTNKPYEEGSPFYYLVGFADESAGLTDDHISLQKNGVIFNGMLDTVTGGNGPNPLFTVRLPGDLDNEETNNVDE